MSPWFGPRRYRRPPPWWPAGEPWPPQPRAFRSEQRARFIRRSGWYGFIPLWILAWIVLNNLVRWAGAGRPRGGGVAVLLLGAAIAATIALILRFIAAPLADVATAADRIKARDYRVRVAVPRRGPSWVVNTARAFNAMAVELETQDQGRRNLMADIAHELRTPLAILQGQIEGLIDGVYPRDDERLQKLLDETRMLGRLVEDLRTLATAESGALALSREPTDIHALANDVVSAFEAPAVAKGVTLTVTGIEHELPPIDVDPVRIREVLMNLVSNALRHTPAQGRVDIAMQPLDRQLELRVVDSGAGMTDDELRRVLDRFFKGSGSSGSGLGLTIARSLVEAHGGTIRAESRVGEGTTMVILIPR
jgi:signal transduction histidine kinase